jgi:hypothetical protein
MPGENVPPQTPFWIDEKDWLCMIEFLLRYSDEDRARGAETIGYLFAYASMTDTRMVALLSDPGADCYEFLLSFNSDANKEKFLRLVQSNELTETEPELIMVPSRDEIADAGPLGSVLSEEVLRQVYFISASVVAGTDDLGKPN